MSFKMPHVFALITMVILFCCLMTYLVPSGKYERKTQRINNSSKTVVVPDTYEQVEKHVSVKGVILGDKQENKATPVSFLGFLTAIPRGMGGAADIIFFIFIIGGAIGVLERTGVIVASIQALVKNLGDVAPVLVIGIVFVLAVCSSTL